MNKNKIIHCFFNRMKNFIYVKSIIREKKEKANKNPSLIV